MAKLNLSTLGLIWVLKDLQNDHRSLSMANIQEYCDDDIYFIRSVIQKLRAAELLEETVSLNVNCEKDIKELEIKGSEVVQKSYAPQPIRINNDRIPFTPVK